MACKSIKINGSSVYEETMKMFRNELAAYDQCSGPYIITVYGWSTEISSLGSTCLLIAMEYMPKGSLAVLLRDEYPQLTYRKKLLIACNVASGMCCIHENQMIHRDLRADNILINNCYQAKIGDMGISRRFQQYTTSSTSVLTGCERFMPPEFYQNIVTDKIDIFTFGLMLNHLFTGTEHEYRSTTRTISITEQSSIFSTVISHCLQSDYKQRPTAKQIERILHEFTWYLEEKIAKYPKYHQLSKEKKDDYCLSLYHERYIETKVSLLDRIFACFP